MPNRVGQQLSQYYLTRLLGRSAVAELYLAEHTRLGTEATVKVLQVDLSPEELESFLGAARTLPNLVHSNVLQVIEVGLAREATANLPFLVMEYVPNGSLRQRHPVGSQLPPPALLAYVRPLAEALHAVHLQGFVHGDVKPENILIGSNEQLLLSDCSSGLLSLLTETVTGTVAYMAPELFRGEIYPASDQYALGIMIYEWLCGALPFSGALREIANQHQSVLPPSLSARTPGISPAVEEVILKALAKEPGMRFGSVLEFADAFDRAIISEYGRPLASLSEFAPTESQAPMVDGWARGAPSPAGPATAPILPGSLPSRRWAALGLDRSQQGVPPSQANRISRRTLIAALPILAVAGGSLAAWLLNQGGSSTSTAFSPTILTYRAHAGALTALAWSPDGAYLASGANDHTIHIWHAQTGANVFTSHSNSGGIPALTWSPDSTRIASASVGPTSSGGSPAQGNAIQVWYAANGKPIYSYGGHSGGITDVVWAPQGERIASASTDYTVQVWQATTGLHPLIYHTQSWYAWALAWSPDGTRIASGGPDGSIQIWNSTSGTTLSIYRGHTAGVEALAWSPDGSRLASASDDRTVRIWDTASGAASYIYRGHAGYVRCVTWSPDGNYIASGGSDKTVQLWNASIGGTYYTYHGHSAGVTKVVWSPDGQFIASGSEDRTVQVWERQVP